MSPWLAATYHDPDDRLYDQAVRVLHRLTSLFGGVAVDTSPRVPSRTVDLLEQGAVRVRRRAPEEDGGLAVVGRARRQVISLALEHGASRVLYCDFDRVLHWAEFRQDELRALCLSPDAADCVVLGRTARAFASHPRVQRDTEAVINQVFARVSGHDWDVTGAARILSRRAVQAIVVGCDDDGISTDCSWPLFLARAGGFSLAYRETEGLEFETADRYAEEIAAVGGIVAWLDRLDADPRQWALRLEVARQEVAAMIPYGEVAGYG